MNPETLEVKKSEYVRRLQSVKDASRAADIQYSQAKAKYDFCLLYTSPSPRDS